MIARIRRAVISVAEKAGVLEFAKVLNDLRVEILSTGGTAKLLRENNIPVKDIAVETGFPEILGGRVKTLHPIVHGGILALRDQERHRQDLQGHNIRTIDLVVVNLYPFEQAAKRANITIEDLIEEIDIGGVTLLRAAAKNYKWVAVVSSSDQYRGLQKELVDRSGSLSDATRAKLSLEAFARTASYDAAIVEELNRRAISNGDFPDVLVSTWKKKQDLRYGENPHQKAGFYASAHPPSASLVNAKQLHGKELSFNNIMDGDAAMALILEFDQPAAAIIKHTNPCGVAVAETIDGAYEHAHACDPLSAFGGIIALNREPTKAVAEHISQQFVEIVMAPRFSREAMDMLTKKKSLRILEIPALVQAVGLATSASQAGGQELGGDIKKVRGGLLVQTMDAGRAGKENTKLVTTRVPTDQEQADMEMAWKVAKHVKSNAIVIVRKGATVGIGMGQTSRVGSVKIACEHAGAKAKGAVMASDGFFPKPDNIEVAAKAGVTAVIQPGGSVEDKQVIEAAERHKVSMLFTSVRHFKH